MGFFDLFASRKKNPPQPSSASPTPATPAPNPAPAPVPVPAPPPVAPPPAPKEVPAASASAAPGSLTLKQALIEARARLDARDLPSALKIYEDILAHSGDRADVLVSISGDLGACGFVETIIELIAPRYDAERHGPATGLNILQAYLLTRNPVPAQHVLDMLFGLQKPELADRLHGFSNAVAELIEGQRLGLIAPPGAPESTETGQIAPPAPPVSRSIALASISKPIWAYGVEEVPGLLPPAKEGRLRRVGFAQIALLAADVKTLSTPETALTRLARGIPLWLAETFYFSPHYNPIAAVGMAGNERLISFPTEWTPDNIRQLVETATGGLDYVFTGALRVEGTEHALTLKVWEVKKLKERKQFTVTWEGEAADEALKSLLEQVRLFMEWQPYPGGPTPPTPASPYAWCDSLGHSLHLFLADKAVVPYVDVAQVGAVGLTLAKRSAESDHAAVLWYTALDRAARLSLMESFPPLAAPAQGAMAEAARIALGR